VGFVDTKKKTVLCRLEVRETRRISPNFVRVTVGGDDLANVEPVGHDHWFRLFLPHEEGETSFDLPERFDLLGYLAYLRMPGATRPHQRNYTVREFRPELRELDIDFVVHGDEGVATRWATRTRPGDRIAIIDQGTGFDTSVTADDYLLVADETGLPAVAGILRDLPRDARGLAIIEVPDAADAQETGAPEGFEVRYLTRPHGARPGSLALEEAKAWAPGGGTVSAYLVGEQQLAAGLRRWLVTERDVPKKSVVFSGYWRLGKS
jgi:NADPH-dependent ferric siderophore reductase